MSPARDPGTLSPSSAVPQRSRSRPPTPRGRRTRDKVLAAARIVFERDGFVLASIVEITREAGVANGTFYTYFDSKEEVFLEILQQFVDRVIAGATDSGPPQDEDLVATLTDFFDAYVEDGRLLRVLAEAAEHSPVVLDAKREMRRASVAFAADRMRLLQQAGVADPALDPTLLADLLGGLMEAAVYNHAFLDPASDRRKVIAAMALIWERALLATPSPAVRRARRSATT